LARQALERKIVPYYCPLLLRCNLDFIIVSGVCMDNIEREKKNY